MTRELPELITDEPTVQIVTAHKELVEQLIELDTHNRHKRPSQIARLTTELNQGKWVLTNQGIGVTSSGYICDGGHRLQAMKEANYPAVPFILATGLDPIAQNKVDWITMKRTMTDVLALFLDTKLTPKITSSLKYVQHARWGWPGKATIETPEQLAKLTVEFSQSLTDLRGLKSFWAMRAAMSAALLEYYHYSLDKTRVLDFVNSVTKGINLQENTPGYVLNRLLAMSKKFRGSYEVSRDFYAKVVSCCERHYKNQPMEKVYGQEKWTIFKTPVEIPERWEEEIAKGKL